MSVLILRQTTLYIIFRKLIRTHNTKLWEMNEKKLDQHQFILVLVENYILLKFQNWLNFSLRVQFFIQFSNIYKLSWLRCCVILSEIGWIGWVGCDAVWSGVDLIEKILSARMVIIILLYRVWNLLSGVIVYIWWFYFDCDEWLFFSFGCYSVGFAVEINV